MHAGLRACDHVIAFRQYSCSKYYTSIRVGRSSIFDRRSSVYIVAAAKENASTGEHSTTPLQRYLSLLTLPATQFCLQAKPMRCRAHWLTFEV